MSFLRSKFRILAVLFVLMVLPACSSSRVAPQGLLPDATASPSASPLSATQTGEPSGGQPSQLNDPALTQAATAATQATTATATREPLAIDWREAPIMPEVSQRVLQIYQDGLAQGRNPHSFSVIGDCQAVPYVFMGPFERGELAPGDGESYLWEALNQFKGSFVRSGMAVRGGFTAASVLNQIQADPHYCKTGETPLTCEYRLNNPAFVFITLETWLDPKTTDRYEAYLRKILDYVIERGSVPILLTKADSSEMRNGTHVFNPVIVQVAYDYDVPVINFWRAAQYLDNSGIDPEREGFHLSQEGYDLKNTLALRTLYKVWKAVDAGNAGSGNPGIGNSTATPVPQATSTAQPGPAISVPDCGQGCIYFASALSHDGVVKFQGVYAYAYGDQELKTVLGEGYNLQDVSEDGQRLLVNNANLLYEVNLADASTNLVSDSFFSLGKQGAYWNGDDSKIVLIDQNQPIQTETGTAFNLFPSLRQERYFESGSCISQDYCQSAGIYRLGVDQSVTRLEPFLHPVFSPDGRLAVFLNPASATAENYYHINYLLLEEPDRGIASRRVFYLPNEKGFMVYPDVREYTFSPDNNNLFIIDDVYSDYFENSLRIQTYLLDTRTGILYEYGKLSGPSGSLNPRMVWAPQGDKLLFFLTDKTPDNRYTLGIYQTRLNSEERLEPFDLDIMENDDYFYITNLYWR